MNSPVYLDYNATAPLRPAATEAMARAQGLTGNPSSVHSFGRQARAALETAREQVAALAGAKPAQLVFTSGGTEANNLALAGSGRTRILVSMIEHDSVLAAAPESEHVPVTAAGVVDLVALERLLQADKRPALVCVMLANNETGIIQPLAEVVAIAHRAGALVHCDAVQAAGKLPLDFVALGVDLMSLSAHKYGGPKGAGALIVADTVPFTALLRGGGQERGRRAGTENVAAIAGFGAAAVAARRDLSHLESIAEMRDRLERDAAADLAATRIIGLGAPRLANTSCLALPGVPAETLVMALDLAGVAVSAGSACSSGKVKPSHVLTAMGLGAEIAGSAIRVSLGWASKPADVERFLAVWNEFAARRGRAASSQGGLTAA
ncbi:MAG: cysteine desulfurase family protein [Dongiaceae bacterium]